MRYKKILIFVGIIVLCFVVYNFIPEKTITIVEIPPTYLKGVVIP